MSGDAIDWIAAALLLTYAAGLLVLAWAINRARDEEPDDSDMAGA